MPRIDAHQHFWHYDPDEYAWIDADMRPLQRDFLPAELDGLLRASGVTGSVAVQARQTIEETNWLLRLAARTRSILGVVGWLPLSSPEIDEMLQEARSSPLLKGLRHVVQAEPPGFLDGPEFNRGVRALTRSGLVYDILIYAPQLEEATRFVDAHPNQSFVLDHLAKPAIRQGEHEIWARDLRELAQRSNVQCKISGMVTEADPQNWSQQQLEPYFETALEAFGPHRLLAGSDWPVLTLGCSYAAWWQILDRWTARLTEAEREAILGGNACRVYGLHPASASS